MQKAKIIELHGLFQKQLQYRPFASSRFHRGQSSLANVQVNGCRSQNGVAYVHLASFTEENHRLPVLGFEVEIEQLEIFGFSCSAFGQHSWFNITNVKIEHLKMGCFYCKNDLHTLNHTNSDPKLGWFSQISPEIDEIFGFCSLVPAFLKIFDPFPHPHATTHAWLRRISPVW